MTETSHSFTTLLVTLAAILVAARLLGHAARRIGQPAVLGELLAGVLLGPSVLGLVDPTEPVLVALAALGVLILLFEIGLDTALSSLLKVGAAAGVVGTVGVVLPFAGGYLIAVQLGLPSLTAVVCGAALTATSIGISARVLSDLGRLDSLEGRITLGAAVLDDIIGLIVLSVVSGLAAGQTLSALGVARTTGVAVGFLVAALVAGRVLAPHAVRWGGRVQVPGALGSLAVAGAFMLAALADVAGSAMIVGAFAAGTVLQATKAGKDIQKAVTGLGHFFVPLFFAQVGALADLRTLTDSRILAVGGLLTAVAILGKLASGFAPFWIKADHLLIGVAMIPRGEVGLIFAQMGLAAGVLTGGQFGALVLMVVVTTFVTPPWLSWIAPRRKSKGPPPASGIGDLVSGDP
jgi:Kef-type K+ transport system membrane component KefB